MKLKYHVTPGDTIQTDLGVGLVTAVEVTKFVGFDLGSTDTWITGSGTFKLSKISG